MIEMQLGDPMADVCPFCRSGKTSVQTWSATGQPHERSVHQCEDCSKLYTVHWIGGYPHHIHPGQEYIRPLAEQLLTVSHERDVSRVRDHVMKHYPNLGQVHVDILGHSGSAGVGDDWRKQTLNLKEAAAFVGDIERETLQNHDYRHVLYTTKKSQLVLMSLKPNESIGTEHHPNDQFFRIEQGQAQFVVDGKASTVGPGDAVVVPAGATHNVTNLSATQALQLYTVYAPAHHPPGTVEKTKADAARAVKAGLDEQLDGLALARYVTDRSPSEAQKKAGNYAKGKLTLHGMPITLENPKGSMRSGKDRSGKMWKSRLTADYGYVNGTIGKDKDHLDIFIGPHHESELMHVVDQVNPRTKSFDEHKIVAACRSTAEARALYLANYAKGWKGLGAITPLHVKELKSWMKYHDTTKPMQAQHAKRTFVSEAVDEMLGDATFYDREGHITARSRPAGPGVQRYFDDRGRLRALTRQFGNETIFFDQEGRRVGSARGAIDAVAAKIVGSMDEGEVIRVPREWWRDPKPFLRVAGTAPVIPIARGVHGRTPAPKRKEKFTPGRGEHMLRQIAASLPAERRFPPGTTMAKPSCPKCRAPMSGKRQLHYVGCPDKKPL